MTTMTMTSRRGDLNLNLTPPPDYEDHVKEGLRQAMLQHEIVFKHQVQELHRLYWTQKRLMDELCLRGSDSVSTSDVEKGPAEEKEASEISAVDSVEIIDSGREVTNGFSEENSSGFSPRVSGHLEVEFSASKAKVNVLHGSKALAYDVMNVNPSQVTVSSDFSFASRTWNESGHRSTEKCSYRENLTGRWHKNSGHSDAGLEEHGASLSANSPSEQQKPKCQLAYFDLNVAQDDESNKVYPIAVEAFPSPSTSSSIVHNGVNLRASSVKCSKKSDPSNSSARETTIMVQAGIVSLDSEISRGKSADSLTCEPKDSYPSSVQTSVRSSTVENYRNHRDYVVDKKVYRSGVSSPEECSKDFELGKRGKGNIYSSKDISVSSDFLENNCLHATDRSANLPPKTTQGSKKNEIHKEGSEEDTSSSHVLAQHENEQDRSRELPTGVKINQLSGDGECTSEKRCPTKHASNSENFGTTRLFLGMPEKIYSYQDPHVDVLQPKEDLVQKFPKVAEMDSTIVKAAETLLSISSENLLASDEKREPEPVDGNDQPQFSDSFEIITLKLQEILDDGSSLCARQRDNRSRKDASGFRLRRGARDFQKDILPGIISLSRHEICEDLYTIKCELRKNQSPQDANCTVPARSRRSRIYAHHK